jgi:hypothetical protein
MKEQGKNPKSEIRNAKSEMRISFVCALVFLAGTLALAMNHAAAIGADDDSLWKPFLSDEDFAKLVQSEVKAIQDELAKPKPDEKKIRGSAIIIALAAQNNKGSGDPMHTATIRDTAFKLVEASKKPAEAKKLSAMLANFKELKGDPQANTQPVDLKKQIEDLKDAMDIFGLPTKGGEGIEKEYLILGQQRKPFSAAQLSDKVVMMAYKTALIAEVARAHQDQANKKPKDWLRMTDDMRRASLEFADAARAKKAKETKSALNKLSASCNDCHAAFRDK